MGHFVIKANDGTYGVAFANLHHTGKLEPGQFVVCPNVYSYSQKSTTSLLLHSLKKVNKTKKHLTLRTSCGIMLLPLEGSFFLEKRPIQRGSTPYCIVLSVGFYIW